MQAESKQWVRRTTVFLVEDQLFTAEGLKRFIDAMADFQFAGWAQDGEQGLAEILRITPEIVVLDLGLPRLNGVQLTRRLQDQAPGSRIIWLTGYPPAEFLETARCLGVCSVLHKSCSPEQLENVFYEARIPNSGTNFVDESAPCFPGLQLIRGKCVQELLSPRQQQILGLIAKGCMTKEIADALSLSPRTVETHRKQISARLGICTIAGLTRFAVRNGLYPL